MKRKRLRQQLMNLVEAIKEKGFLARKVIEHGHFRHVGRGGNVGNGDMVEPALDKEPCRCVRKVLTCSRHSTRT